MKIYEVTDNSFQLTLTEIEFVCVNKDVPGSTPLEKQTILFKKLKNIPNIIVYKQDFDEDEDAFSGGKSLSAVVNTDSGLEKVINLAKNIGVKIDVVTEIEPRILKRRLNSPYTTNWYNTGLKLK